MNFRKPARRLMAVAPWILVVLLARPYLESTVRSWPLVQQYWPSRPALGSDRQQSAETKLQSNPDTTQPAVLVSATISAPTSRPMVLSSTPAAPRPVVASFSKSDLLELDTLQQMFDDYVRTAAADRPAAGQSFLDRSAKFVAAHPDAKRVWLNRAFVAYQLNLPVPGNEAGKKLKSLGEADSDDPQVHKLIVLLNACGWLGDHPLPVTTRPSVAAAVKPAALAGPRPAAGPETDQDRYARAQMQAVLNELRSSNDVAEQQTLLKELFRRTDLYLMDHFDSRPVWLLRAISAKQLDRAVPAGEAASTLKELGALEKGSDAELTVIAEIDRKGWIERYNTAQAALQPLVTASKQGPPEGMIALGDRYADRGQYARAMKCYAAVPKAGAGRSYWLRGMYWAQCGRAGVSENCYAQALAWVQKGVDAGDGRAMDAMGDLCKDGLGVPADSAAAVSWYQKSAEAGCTDGMVDMGMMCRDGRGAGRDLAEAMRWFRKAADAGSVSGFTSIGWLFAEGVGVERDCAEAMTWFRKGANAGGGEAMASVGSLYRDGNGVDQDYAQAMSWFSKAADAGSAVGMNCIGTLYAAGHGVPQDYTQAMSWYQKAADAGSGDGMLHIGMLYRDGSGVDPDFQAAMSWFKKSAAVGDTDAAVAIGGLYRDGKGVPKDVSQAMTWFRKAADAGNRNAMNAIGCLYRDDRGIRDYTQAMTWFKRSADAGSGDAMCCVGGLYYSGLGVDKDYTQAMNWFRKGADAGDRASMVWVGALYRDGLGVTQDYYEAMAWFRKSAYLGDHSAMMCVGEMYRAGWGVTADEDEAQKWFTKAKGSQN